MPLADAFWYSLYAVGILIILVIAVLGFLFWKYWKYGKSGNVEANAKVNAAATWSGIGSSEWFNQTVAWLHSHHQQQQENWRWITDAWLRALTDEIKTHAPPDLSIRLDGDHKLGNQPPQFTNFSTDGSTNQALILKTEVALKDCSLLAYIISKGTNNSVSVKCEVKLHELLGQLQAKIDEDRERHARMVVSFVSKPILNLEVIPNTYGAEIDRNVVERVICDAFSKVVLNLPLYSPGGHQSGAEIFESCQQTQLNSFLQTLPAQNKKLFVKVIKANGLSDSGLSEPFCEVSAATPRQRYATSSVRNTAHPFFDEHFMFDLSDSTKTIVFEMRDKNSTEGDSLGRAELTLDDITRSENCRHVLPLIGQSTTYGSLTVEVITGDHLNDTTASMIPNVEHVLPNKTSNSLQDSGISLSGAGVSSGNTLEMSGSESLRQDKPESTSPDALKNKNQVLPRIETLPPKGESKRRSIASAIKNRFKRKKEPRSQSADGPASSGKGVPYGEGIYLTPPPLRNSATLDHYNGPSEDEQLGRSRSHSFRSNFRRLFHKKETTSGSQRNSPSRVSNPGDIALTSREGSSGQPSPVLKSYAQSYDDALFTENRSRASTVSAI